MAAVAAARQTEEADGLADANVQEVMPGAMVTGLPPPPAPMPSVCDAKASRILTRTAALAAAAIEAYVCEPWVR
jgi:hypothetical protein